MSDICPRDQSLALLSVGARARDRAPSIESPDDIFSTNEMSPHNCATPA